MNSLQTTKKIMKKILYAGLIMIFSSTSFAQIQRKVVKQKTDSSQTVSIPEQGPDNKRQMYQELDLSKEQRIKLKEFNQSMKASKEAIENDATLSDSEKKLKLRTLRKEQANKVLSILSEEQKIKLKQLREQKGTKGDL